MNYKKLFSIFVLILILALAFFYIYKNFSDFKSLTLVSPHLIFYIVIFFLINYIFIGIITRELIASLNVKLSHKESFMISVFTGFYNLITPLRGGMAARAVYLKKKHNFSYSNFFATLSASYVLTFLIAGFLGLLSTYLIYSKEGILSIPLLILFLGAFTSMLLIITISPKFKLTKNSLVNKFINVINGWHLIKSNIKLVSTISILTIIQILIASYMLQLQFQVFGIEISFMKCLFLSSIGSLSILIAITPANLGIAEAVTVFSALTIGISAAESLSAAILGRLIQTVILFILGPIFSYILIKPLNSSSENGNKITVYS